MITTQIVYINPIVSDKLSHPDMRELMKQELRDWSWKDMTMHKGMVPDPEIFDLESPGIRDAYFMGIGMQQLMEIKKESGIFINPMSVSLMFSPELCGELIKQKLGDSYVIRFISVPYEIYKRCCEADGESIIAEPEYNMVNKSLSQAVCQAAATNYSSTIH